MRFELLDRIVEEDVDRVVAVKHVSSGEEYLADHFPTFPVLPGVLMLEALTQAASRLLRRGGRCRRPVATDVRNLKFGAFVPPGDVLRVEATLRRERAEGWEFAGSVTRENGQVAAQGRFRLGESPRAAGSAEGAAR